MEIIIALALFGAIIFIGSFAEWFFKKSQIPDVILLIAIGIVLGFWYDIQQPSLQGVISLFTTFALIFILFEGALRLEAQQLFVHLPKSMALTVVSFVLTAAVTFLVAFAVGLEPLVSLYLGFILGGISSAVVIPIVKVLEISTGGKSILTLESAISDVLCIVSTVIFTDLLVRATAFDAQGFANNFFGLFLIAIALGAGIGWVWQRILKHYRPQNSYMLTIALILIVYSLTEWMQANGAIAALAFGIVLGNAKKVYESLHPNHHGQKKTKTIARQVVTHQARAFYAEISFFVKTFFFVYLGMLIDFSSPISFLIALLLTIGFFLIRPVAVYLSRAASNDEEAGVMEIMVPKGLAAAVLAAIPLQAGIPGTEVIPSIVVAVILLSIIGTSILVFLMQRGIFRGVYRWKRVE